MRPLPLLTLLAFAACHRDPSPTSSTTDAPLNDPSHDAPFLSWFTAHQAEVATVQSADDPPAAALARELHKVDPALTFEVGVKPSPHELIVSADGNPKLFPTVKRLVAAAPVVPNWKVIAFRPRHGADLALEMGDGLKLRASDIVFHAVPTPAGTLDVALYVKTMTKVSTAAKEAVFLELDSVLGEHDVETRVAGIDIGPGAAAPGDARPLVELAQVVDALKDAGAGGRAP
jgi:hypothetical protein